MTVYVMELRLAPDVSGTEHVRELMIPVLFLGPYTDTYRRKVHYGYQ
jgi:hypothetical protein